jgi:ABC-type Na+ efflux pump permease subunit
MSNIRLVALTGMKNASRMKTGMIILVSVTLLFVVGIAFAMCLLLIAPEMESAVPDRNVLEGYLGIILYASSLISIGVALNSLVFQTMVREKTRGNLAALMATPLKISDIWLGKTLALFVPGLILAIILTLLVLVIINVIYFLPEFGFVFDWQMMVNSLVLVPVMYLFFGMFVHIIGLTTKPVTGNVIAQIYLPVIANVMCQLTVRDVMNANSWQFMVLNLGLAILLGISILAVRSRLAPERVMLSAG